MAKVQFSHPHGDHNVGDKVELDDAEAKALVRGGIAQYATKSDAEKAGGSPEQAVTAK